MKIHVNVTKHRKNEIFKQKCFCSRKVYKLKEPNFGEKKSWKQNGKSLKKSRVLNFAVLKKICNFPGIYIHGRSY